MTKRKKISVVIPCYNEEGNIPQIYRAISELITKQLPFYEYEILFVENKSTDNSRMIIREICEKDRHVKAIFNRVNCGPNTNPFFGLRESDGDCSVLIDADFQEPVEMIPVMVKAWEEGNKVVCMVKTGSRENKFVYFMRGVYYRIFKAMSPVSQISQFTGFGLYDKSFIELLRTLEDPVPFLKGIVAEYAPDRIEIPYEQQKRREGESSISLLGYYDSAMLSFTSYTKGGLRIAIFCGFAAVVFSFCTGLVYLVQKLLFWDRFAAGNIPILLSVLFLGGVQLFFIGLLGEYVMSINTRVIHRPMVVVEERINFDDADSRRKNADRDDMKNQETPDRKEVWS